MRRDADGWRFVVPGRGDIDCGAIMAALAERNDLPFAVELPLRLRRGLDARPVRQSEPVPLATIEAVVRDSLVFVRRWIPDV